MSFFMPNILAKKVMYKFWVKKIGGMLLGSKCSKNAQKWHFSHFDPPKAPLNFFTKNLCIFFFACIFSIIKDIFKPKDIKGLKMGMETDFFCLNIAVFQVFSIFELHISCSFRNLKIVCLNLLKHVQKMAQYQ